MRAVVVQGVGTVRVEDVPAPVPEAGELVVRVERAGVCGTDLEFVRGTQPYLHTGGATLPLRIGHEWAGIVDRVGPGVDSSWIGKRVTADTMLGCQRCGTCQAGRQHLCLYRSEIGVLGGRPGALAEQIAVPAFAVRALPEGMSATAGALVEPGSLAYRCVMATGVKAANELVVLGAGTIGLLCLALASASGASTHMVARSARWENHARKFGAVRVWGETSAHELKGRFDAAISASPDASYPALAQQLVRPGGTVVLAGISAAPSPVEANDLVVRDITIKGLLSGSPLFDASIPELARLGPDLESLVTEPLTLEELASSLSSGLVHQGAPKTQAAVYED